MADFILDVDIKKPMPASLGIAYLVVMFLVDISNTTGKAYAIMTGYLQSLKQLSFSALRQWFPEKEGINLSIVKGGLCGNKKKLRIRIRHEKRASVDDIQCHRGNPSEQLGQAAGNTVQYIFDKILYLFCRSY